MSLYGKYRPQNFTNLVGQDHIRETLLHEILKGSLTHAYLFAGPRGTGKTSTARLIAKALNCEKKSKEGEPCEECDFCKTIADGSLIDVVEIDAASNRGIDEIRDLKEKIQFAPTRAKTKIYIIDEVHMMTKEAFNALLKTLEEPPENVYFILCTTELHKIPETIISRCQHFDFKRIDAKTIMTRLSYIAQMESIEAEDAAIEMIARHVEGGLRDAIGLLEQMTINNKLTASHVRDHLGITGHETITTLLDVIEKKELTKALHIINEVHNEGYDLNSFVREILECLRDRLITAVQQGQPKTDLWLSMIEIFEEARNMLRNTVIPQLPLEIAVIKLCGEGAKAGPEPAKKETGEKTAEQKDASPELSAIQTSEQSTQEEKQTAQSLKQEYEMEKYGTGDLAKAWPRVLERISPPSLKRSLATAKISEAADGNIKLIFNSNFHIGKVNLVESKAQIEKVIEQISGKKVKLTCELDSSMPQTAQEKSAKPKETAENLAKKVMEMFGEE